MARIQFYPGQDLEKKLRHDAEVSGASVSSVVEAILLEHYGLSKPTVPSMPALVSEVLKEVEQYINSEDAVFPFDLYHASKTFSQISMVYSGKPSTIRARIGKAFAEQVGKPGRFCDVRAVLREGRIVQSENHAALYDLNTPKERSNNGMYENADTNNGIF